MELIISPKRLTEEFNQLLKIYDKCYFATAWAGIPNGIFDELLDNLYKVKKFVVGIHFYQTDPAFFNHFINNESVRAVLQPSGTFHPKVFLFYRNDTDWTLLIGSANFTNAAFTKNTEAVLSIDAAEADLNVLQNVHAVINNNWETGKIIDKDFLEAYKLKWQYMQRRLEIDSINEQTDIMINGPTAFMQLSWDKYVALYDGKKNIVSRRFVMLETIRKIFATGRSLIEMSEDERRLITGNPNDLDMPGADRYADFGTSGNGQFMNKMIKGNQVISDALDKIPLVGDVGENNFNEFVDVFLTDPDITGGWVSSAARILTMKRPDVFFNITKANRAGFCGDFDLIQDHTKQLENYWRLIVQRIQISNWCQNAKPKNSFEKKLRESRAAMLDVLYYFE